MFPFALSYLKASESVAVFCPVLPFYLAIFVLSRCGPASWLWAGLLGSAIRGMWRLVVGVLGFSELYGGTLCAIVISSHFLFSVSPRGGDRCCAYVWQIAGDQAGGQGAQLQCCSP